MKTLILITILFLTLSIPCCAQFHNVKGVRIVERTTASDSTTISGVGQIQYDGTDDKLRFNDGNGWYSFLRDDATLPYWPLSGSATITGNTTIATSFPIQFDLSHDGFGDFGQFDIDLNTTNLFQITATRFFAKSPISDLNIELDNTFSVKDDTDELFILGAEDLTMPVVGYGIRIAEGANAIMGTATLSSGTITVNTTKVTDTSRIFLTVNGGTLTNVGTPYVSARSAGTSFTITSTNGSDAADVAWLIIEPAP